MFLPARCYNPHPSAKSTRGDYLLYLMMTFIATPEEQEEYRNLVRDELIDSWNKEVERSVEYENRVIERDIAYYKKNILELRSTIEGLEYANKYQEILNYMETYRVSANNVPFLKGFREVNLFKENLNIEADDAFNYLGKFFSERQLKMIESAFERGDGFVYEHNADYFCDNVLDASDRMRLIMENIITNKGTFCPQKLPKRVVIWVTPGFKG